LPKEELYDKVADLIIAHKIDRVIGWWNYFGIQN
jgi:hypothetical protein